MDKKRDNKKMGFLIDAMDIDDENYENESTYVGSEFKPTPAFTHTPEKQQVKLDDGYFLRSGQTESRFSNKKEQHRQRIEPDLLDLEQTRNELSLERTTR